MGSLSYFQTRFFALLCLCLPFIQPSAARAAFDWPVDWNLPAHDLSVGLTGGINFGEEGRGFNRGPVAGLSLAYHHELLGIQFEVAGRKEGLAQHLGGSLEVVFWYVALVGGGVTYWEALTDPGRDIPQKAWGVSGYIGIPIPIFRTGTGAIALTPYARPGLRFATQGNVQGHHEAGIRVSWTTFGF